MGKVKYAIGQKVTSSKSGIAEIVDKIPNKNVYIIRFIETGYCREVSTSSLKRGTFKDPYQPTVYGVGYLGVGKYKVTYRENGKSYATKAREVWSKMLFRCYNEEHHKDFPTYEDYSVCTEWFNFQNFAEWFYQQPFEDDFHLDKDLRVAHSKVYSPDTCTMIPARLNTLFLTASGKNNEKGLGVTAEKGRFRADIHSFSGKAKFLGYYNTIELAQEAYNKAKGVKVKEAIEFYRSAFSKETYSRLHELLDILEVRWCNKS